MPPIPSSILEFAKDVNCNVFIESGGYTGTSFDKALKTGFFDHCYTVEIDPVLYRRLVKRFPKRNVFLGKSHEVFASQIFPLCKPTDRILFWLDGHYSKAKTGGAEYPCPLLEELEAIENHCPTDSIVVVIDDTDDFGHKDDKVLGLNWPTRKQVEDAAYRINPMFLQLDFTKGDGRLGRGILIFSYSLGAV